MGKALKISPARAKQYGIRLGGEVLGEPVSRSAGETAIPTLTVDQILSAADVTQNYNSPQDIDYGGDKFLGGFGPTQLLRLNYWELRARSAQLFHENLFARGLVRRLVTNEINTGLSLESMPEESILGVPEDSLTDWSEDVERRFELWGKYPLACDYEQENTFAWIQATARREAIIEGDILCVILQNPLTQRPYVKLISGRKVQTPWTEDGTKPKIPKTHTILHGVEKDANGRKVAYWVQMDDGKFQRLEAFGKRSGRRISWLVYGTDKRKDDVRGEPLLSVILQSLKEVDRYRDAVQRKAVINSILALFVQKGEAKPSSLPFRGGAVKNSTATVTDSSGDTRDFNVANQIPGLTIEEMQHGETVVGFGNEGINQEYGAFETAMLRAVAWANEIPPEILFLSFANNYSASQAAINEFKMYLNMKRTGIGAQLCQPIYVEWILSEVQLRRITANGMIEAWRDPMEYEIFCAWTLADWSGAIKPSTDLVKTAKGYGMMMDRALITGDRASRETTGTKYSRNAKKRKKENELLVESLTPLAEFKQQFAQIADELLNNANGGNSMDAEAIVEQTAEALLELMPAAN